MNPTFVQPTIDLIKFYAMHGLIHGRRHCQFCYTEMRLIKTDKDDLGSVGSGINASAGGEAALV